MRIHIELARRNFPERLGIRRSLLGTLIIRIHVVKKALLGNVHDVLPAFRGLTD
jgi:hypothetical protein